MPKMLMPTAAFYIISQNSSKKLQNRYLVDSDPNKTAKNQWKRPPLTSKFLLVYFHQCKRQSAYQSMAFFWHARMHALVNQNKSFKSNILSIWCNSIWRSVTFDDIIARLTSSFEQKRLLICPLFGIKIIPMTTFHGRAILAKIYAIHGRD